MKKSILMAFSPYQYYLIAEGIKTIEIRKRIPKSKDWDGMIFCYMREYDKSFLRIPKELQEKYRGHFGKVGMLISCEHCDGYPYDEHVVFPCPAYDGDDSSIDAGAGYWITSGDLDKACRTHEELIAYGKGKTLYGLHITDLLLYSNPKDWYGFLTPSDTGGVSGNHYLSRPPYSWQYVETF